MSCNLSEDSDITVIFINLYARLGSTSLTKFYCILFVQEGAGGMGQVGLIGNLQYPDTLHKHVLNKKTCKLVIMCARGHVTKSCDTALQATMKFAKTMRASGSVKVLEYFSLPHRFLQE